jgi:hypothetical protein
VLRWAGIDEASMFQRLVPFSAAVLHLPKSEV